MCKEYTSSRVKIEYIKAQKISDQEGFKIQFDYMRKSSKKIEQGNHIIPISILKLIIQDLIDTGTLLSKNDLNDIFDKIVFCWNDIMKQEDLDIIKDDLNTLRNLQVVNNENVEKFFRDQFFPYIFYVWDHRATVVFNKKKSDYLKEAREVKNFNKQAEESFKILMMQAKKNQLKSEDAMNTLESIFSHFCDAVLDMPICLRITIEEAKKNLEENVQDYNSLNNFGKSYFHNILDYNLKNKHFNAPLFSDATIASYLQDIVYDIQRIFNIWTLSLKLQLKGNDLIKAFSDKCQMFLSEKNIGMKILTATTKMFNVKQQDLGGVLGNVR